MHRSWPKRFALLIVPVLVLAWRASTPSGAASGERTTVLQSFASRLERFVGNTSFDPERSADPTKAIAAASEAPAAFDNRTNGFDRQGPDFDTIDEDNVEPGASFNDNRFIFEEIEDAEEGLGPTYNAQGCVECHQNIVTGGASQIAEHRTGRVTNGAFFESLGGSLIHSRATHPEIQERVHPADGVRTFRMSTSILGAGFIEAIANQTLVDIRDRQPWGVRGSILVVPVLEADGFGRIGRFGWKNQHASLESFSADAYLNEMGITSPLLPDENTASGESVADYDEAEDPEDEDGEDVLAFANFMRATKAPPRGAITQDVVAGAAIFKRVGCEACHVSSIVTAPAGTPINGGAIAVHEAVGDKVIHPYSDFLLHDVGTGDGIPFLPGQEYAWTANRIRTAPLWGLRTKNRLMHDGLSFTVQEAIQRHRNQGSASRNAYSVLTSGERAQLFAFLDSL